MTVVGSVAEPREASTGFIVGLQYQCANHSGQYFASILAEDVELHSLLNSVVALCVLICLSACDRDSQRQGDIYLPEGDAARGKMHFVSLGCVNCHSVIGAELPEPAQAGPVRVLLGSQTGLRMSYGQLITSIVNPSHRLSPRHPRDKISREGESLMTLYNDVLTVTQLTDLVAFLQAHYEQAERPGYVYPAHTYKAKGDSEEADPK